MVGSAASIEAGPERVEPGPSRGGLQGRLARSVPCRRRPFSTTSRSPRATSRHAVLAEARPVRRVLPAIPRPSRPSLRVNGGTSGRRPVATAS